MVVFFAEGVDGSEDGGGGEVGACAVEVFVQSVLRHQLFAAKKIGVCGGRGCGCEVSGRSMWFAVGVVGGGLDEEAVFVYDGDVAAEVVGDVVVGN